MRENERSRMSLFFVFLVLSLVWILTGLPGAQAQETDITQTPNDEQAGIQKIFGPANWGGPGKYRNARKFLALHY